MGVQALAPTTAPMMARVAAAALPRSDIDIMVSRRIRGRPTNKGAFLTVAARRIRGELQC